MKPFRVAIFFTLAAALAAGHAAQQEASKPPAAGASDQPDFVAGWRVTGVLRQGGRVQASLEHASRSPRFLMEGQELSPGVVVEKIDAASRSVTVRRDQQTAVIRTGPAPVLAKAKPSTAQPSPSRPSGPNPPSSPPWCGGAPPVAGQDDQGRWGIRFGNSGFLSAQDYAGRFGGVEQAIAHVNQRLTEDTDQYRRMFHTQMLSALQNLRNSGQPSAATGQQMSQHNMSMSLGATATTPQNSGSLPPPPPAWGTPPPPPPQPPPQQQPPALYTPLPPPPGRDYN